MASRSRAFSDPTLTSHGTIGSSTFADPDPPKPVLTDHFKRSSVNIERRPPLDRNDTASRINRIQAKLLDRQNKRNSTGVRDRSISLDSSNGGSEFMRGYLARRRLSSSSAGGTTQSASAHEEPPARFSNIVREKMAAKYNVSKSFQGSETATKSTKETTSTTPKNPINLRDSTSEHRPPAPRATAMPRSALRKSSISSDGSTSNSNSTKSVTCEDQVNQAPILGDKALIAQLRREFAKSRKETLGLRATVSDLMTEIDMLKIELEVARKESFERGKALMIALGKHELPNRVDGFGRQGYVYASPRKGYIG